MSDATMGHHQGGGLFGRIIIIVLVIVVLVVGAIMLFGKDEGGGSVISNVSKKQVVDPSKFQAVFVANGQVYFGKVENEYADYVTLKDVHYLILTRPLQNQQQGEEGAAAQAKPEYKLRELGSEVHGPSDMHISRDKILFIENLREDSKIVEAIANKESE